ncbi:MAG: O-acetyl-ADP-ribose deacetylase [Alistipes sp.]|nr:O-acetyl-ADP-ribose deacetylase [Candidatus Alistipes equi]
MADKIRLVVGDITKLEVDAIVNAANHTLLGGGGVDGAIHRAAGRELFLECKTLGGCQTGQSKITGAYHLPSKYVIHTVGPVYHWYKKQQSALLLASCYHTSLLLAMQHGIKSIAFPCISCGVYGYPIEEASKVAIKAIRESEYDGEVVICCFSEKDAACYAPLL